MKKREKVTVNTKLSSHRDHLIATLNKMVEIFTSHNWESFNDVTKLALQPVAEAAGLDRIAVYRFLDKEGHLGQTYCWAFDKITGLNNDLQKVPLIPPVIRWLNILKKGECINGNVKTMSEDQAAFCALYDVKSIFLVPIFTHGEFWGAVTLQDHTNYRYFDEDCLDLLCSAARLCANAILRDEMKREAASANELTRGILALIPVGFTVVDENMRFVDCNSAITNTLGTTKHHYLNHFFEYSPEKQPCGRLSREMVKEIQKRALGGEKLAFEWLYRSSSGELIPFEITVSRTMCNGKFLGLIYQYDRRDTNKMMESIREQSELLKLKLGQQKLISDTLKGFISSCDSKTYVEEAITNLDRFHNVSKVVIFEIDNRRRPAAGAGNYQSFGKRGKVYPRRRYNQHQRISDGKPKSLEAGMNSHMGKPLNLDEVLNKLRSYLPEVSE